MNTDNLYIDDIADIVQSDAVPVMPTESPKNDHQDETYPDALSTAGLILFVVGLCLAIWFMVYAL